ncbi:FAD-binding oxidoreductase [Fluviicola sp. SGL-29]|nr:FAD-binding oxidoreductase [Fluviicola sp. SGL-29]
MQKIVIVGGGLAGSCLGVQLVASGCDVTLIDSGINRSSRVAAGMINPLVFRRMTKSWRVDEFIPYAEAFYRLIEQTSGITFFHETTIRRFFSSEQERNFWIERQQTDAFSSYMHVMNEEDETLFPYANQFGSGRVKNSFYLDTAVLLDVLHSLPDIDVRRESFDYSELNPAAGEYRGEQFDGIIFCEGYQSKENPWFGSLPVQSTKGEILTVETEGLSREESLNRKCFTLHTGNGQFKVGATYVWHTDDTTLTEEGKNLLLDNLRYLTDLPVTVVAQHAGVRPTTPDRRPLMGKHAIYNKLFFFNGLGTKGYMMAPLLSKEMADFVTKGAVLHPECDLNRLRS